MFIPSINHVFSLFSILTIYGKFRTDLLTEMAPHTGQRFRNERRMVSLSVERIGYFQHIPGTEFHAKATPLASVLDDINICRWCQIFFPIKGFSPHLHWHDRTFSNNSFTCNWPRTFPLSHLPLRLGKKRGDISGRLSENGQFSSEAKLHSVPPLRGGFPVSNPCVRFI
jgi:hypothetical protein